MRLRPVLLILAMISATACAQVRLSVAEAEQLVLSGNPNDTAPLHRAELSERLSATRLARWQAAVKDPNLRSVLQALADQSAFLPLPKTEIPTVPPPSETEQKAILLRATDYAVSMRKRLPNFLAQRTTTHFEIATLDDIKREEQDLKFEQGSRARLGYTVLGDPNRSQHMFLVGVSRSTVTYRDGAEVRTAEAASKHTLQLMDQGLTSSGEFGSILSLVDRDAAAGTIAWDHWEQGPGKLLAVYAYSIPKDKSHFGLSAPSSFPGLPMQRTNPAYHGEIAIDPADGSIYRIVIHADADLDDPHSLSGIVVEYAPTTIGTRSCICPIHSIAIMSDIESVKEPNLLRQFINDVLFTQYHLFGSESRIIP